MNKLKIILLLFIVLLGCEQQGSKVKRIIDGDTIELINGERVRYIGIDTPETYPPRGPQYYGQEATEANRKLVAGKRIKMEFDVDKKDRYGRTLAYIFVDTIFVNAELLRLGYAKTYFFPPNIRYFVLFTKLENEAKEAGRGIWGKELM